MKHCVPWPMATFSFATVLATVVSAFIAIDSCSAQSNDESVATTVATMYSSTLVRGLLETCVSEVAQTNGLRKTLQSLGPVVRMLDPRIPRDRVTHAISVITNGDHWIADAFLIQATNGSASAVESAVAELRGCNMVLNQVAESNSVAETALKHGVVVKTAAFTPIHIWRCHGSLKVRSSPTDYVPTSAIDSLGRLCKTNYFVYYPGEDKVLDVDPEMRMLGVAYLFLIREQYRGGHRGPLDGRFDRARYEQEN
jgi:hypothetical protein